MSHLPMIQELYAGFAAGDVPAVLGRLAEDVEWTEAAGFPYAGTYRGRQAVLENVFMRLAEDWDDFQVEKDDWVDGGDRIVMLGWYRATCKATGNPMRASAAHAWTIRGGEVVRFVQYVDSAKVLESME